MNKQQFESLCTRVLIPRFADIVRAELVPDVLELIRNDLNCLHATVDILSDEVVRLHKGEYGDRPDAMAS